MQKMRSLIKQYRTLALVGIAFAISVCFSFYSRFAISNEYILFFLILIAVFFLARKFSDNFEKRRLIYSTFYSGLLTISFLVGDKIVYGSTEFLDYKLRDIPAYIGLFAILNLLTYNVICFFCSTAAVREKKLKTYKHPVLLGAGFLLLCWLPYWIAFMPGIIGVDQVVQFKQVVNMKQLSNWHPVVHTLMVGLPVKIGLSLGNATVGIIFTVLLQEILVALILSKAIYVFYKLLKRKVAYIAPLIFFALYPVVASYGVTPWKDIVFSSLFLLLVMHLYGALRKKKNDYPFIKNVLILCFVVPFFRNAGVLISLAVVVLLIVLKKEYRKRIAIIGISIVMSVIIIQGPIYDAIHIISSPFMESMSIPAQQIGYVVRNGEVNEDDMRELQRFANVEKLNSDYSPMHADPAKNSFYYDVVEENKSDFLKLWSNLLVYNFGNYVKAYVYHIYSYWYIGDAVWVNGYDNVHEGEWLQGWDYADINIFGEKYRYIVSLFIRGTERTSCLGFFANVGFLVWSFILLAVIFIYKKMWTGLYAEIPVFVYLASLLIASPVSWIFRYVYSLLLMLPFFIIIAFYGKERARKTSRNLK